MSILPSTNSLPLPSVSRRALLKASASLGVLALTGCGGGGGGGGGGVATSGATAAGSVGSVVAPVGTVSASTYTGPLPSWVPSPGTFSNISQNRLADVAPAGYVLTDAAGPFANWSGGRYNPDYSALGGYVVAGSGHLPTGEVCWSCVNVFNFATLQWEVKDVPATAWAEGQEDAVYGQFPDGTFYMPHTYGGLEIQSASNGGGSQGSLIQFFSAGSGFTYPTRVNRYDLSQSVATYGSSVTRVIDSIPTGGISASYPMTAFDSSRNGWWVLAYNGNGPMFFVDAQNYAMTAYSNAGYNDYGNQCILYLPPPYDFLLGFGNSGPNGVNMSFWGCLASTPDVPWTNLTANVQLQPGTTLPLEYSCGGCWSTILNAVVMYEAQGSNRVHSLIPPAPANLLTGTWTLASETLAGVGGATPCVNTVANNGAYGRFVEVPAARVFAWCDSISGPVQAWRLANM